jgi:hypothetical protein
MWSRMCKLLPRSRSALLRIPTRLSKCSVSPTACAGFDPCSSSGAPMGIWPVDGGCFIPGGAFFVGVIPLTTELASGEPSCSLTWPPFFLMTYMRLFLKSANT